MLRFLIATAVLALGLAGAPVSPAAGPGGTELDQAAARSREALEQARRLEQEADFRVRTRRETERALQAAGQAARRPQAAPPVAVDEETMAKARRDLQALLADPGLSGGASFPAAEDTPPLVFVSLSMPESSLRTLMAEAGRIGAPLILRGLVDGSMKRTVERLGALVHKSAGVSHDRTSIAGRQPSFAIDPTLFGRFGVDKVPAFVLPLEAVVPCAPDGCPVPGHLKVAGDVSLAYALDVMSRESSDAALRERAKAWLDRMEARE